MTRTCVFAGPSIDTKTIRSILPSAEIYPPIKHGDLMQLFLAKNDIVVIIDGYFHQRLPIRHKEILWVISNGVTVVGSSSMGALRAAELKPHGMLGVGRIYRDFVSGVLDGDDEVALVHEDSPPYRQHSIPLVSLRATLKECMAENLVDHAGGNAIVAAIKRLPHHERTASKITTIAKRFMGGDIGPLNRLADEGPELPGSIKFRDAKLALEMVRRGNVDPPGAIPLGSECWTTFTATWAMSFAPARPGGKSAGPDIQRAQAVAPNFPNSWYEHWLRVISGASLTVQVLSVTQMEDKVHSMAEKRGLSWESLGSAGRSAVTRREQQELSVQQLTCRAIHRLSDASPFRPPHEALAQHADWVLEQIDERSVTQPGSRSAPNQNDQTPYQTATSRGFTDATSYEHAIQGHNIRRINHGRASIDTVQPD